MTWDIRGQEWAEQLLRGHIQRKDVHHAYLFAGPQGLGRRSLALRYAQALNCPTPLSPGEPCRTCRVCTQTARMQHIDLSVVQAEREGGSLKVEQIRDLQQSLSLTPYEASYRVALLLRFEEANANSQNALLKTLEEAPARVILLLTADSPESLLPTIISRCEVLRLRPMPLDQLTAELTLRGLPEDEAVLLAHLSGGRLGLALRMNESPDLLEQRKVWLDELMMLASASRRKRFAYAESLSKDKDEMRAAFQSWLSFWRDVLLAAASPDLALTNLDRSHEIRSLAAAVGLDEARRRTIALEHALTQMDMNLNPRLLAEITLLDWPQLR